MEPEKGILKQEHGKTPILTTGTARQAVPDTTLCGFLTDRQTAATAVITQGAAIKDYFGLENKKMRLLMHLFC